MWELAGINDNKLVKPIFIRNWCRKIMSDGEFNSNSNSNEEADLAILLNDFYNRYYSAYAYLAAIVGIAAIISNCLIIVVLTRPKMFSTTNLILTGIACSDLIVLITYLVYIIKWRLFEHECHLNRPTSHGWAIFEVIFANVTLTLRGFSLWLTVAMAALRNQIISSKEPNTHLNTDKNIAIRLILVCGIFVIIMATPIYFSMAVVGEELTFDSNATNESDCDISVGYAADVSALSNLNGDLLYKISFWTNGVSFRLLPCVLLTCYIPALLLKANNFCTTAQNPAALLGHRRSRLNQRTTMILITILITAWITETPHGVVSITCGIFPEYTEMYQALGDIFDLLTLLNCTLTFVLYSTMSKRFRDTLKMTLAKFIHSLRER